MKKKRLGEILTESGKITAADLTLALQKQQQNSMHLGELLLQLGLITRRNSQRAISLGVAGASLRVRGEVRYSLPGVGIGVEFVGLEPAALKLLEREVNCGSAATHIPKRSGAPRCKPKRSQRPRVATKRRRSRS